MLVVAVVVLSVLRVTNSDTQDAVIAEALDHEVGLGAPQDTDET
jgi:hypothetical protein